EVDLLERRTPNLQTLELDALRHRVAGQLVEDARRLASPHEDVLAVPPVPDLDLQLGRRQLARRTDADDAAVAHHRDAVGELLGLVEVVRRQQHRLAELAQRADHLPRGASRGRVEARRRLVEEHEVGVADERDAEVEAPLLTARERLDPRVALLVEADERDHLVDVPGLGVVAGEHRVRLVDREARPQLRVLQHDADPLAELRAGPLRVVPQHAHVAGVPVAVALEDLDRRRLPGAVRPEQAEHLALVDLEVDAAYRLVLAVRLPQAADLDRVHRSRRVCAQGGNAGSGRPPRVATARLQSGWWPTTTTHSPCSAATARMSSGVAPGASRSSTCGSPRPSAAAVSRARSSGLETTASAANPSARSWAPPRRACSCPAAVSVRVSSGVPGAASA